MSHLVNDQDLSNSICKNGFRVRFRLAQCTSDEVCRVLDDNFITIENLRTKREYHEHTFSIADEAQFCEDLAIMFGYRGLSRAW